MVAGRFAQRVPVVYTCVTGGYDVVAPVHTEWKCDFRLFHDGSVEVPTGWRGQLLSVDGLTGADLNRYAKMLPHRLGLAAEESMYVDGNVRFKRDPSERISSVLAESAFAAFAHPRRDCAYAEIRETLRLGFVGPRSAWRLVNKFREARMPRRYGLFEAGVLYRRHNEPNVKALGEMWWQLWRQGLGRDQPLLTAALWKTGLTIHTLGSDLRADPSGTTEIAAHARGRSRIERLPNRLAAELALYRLWLPT